MSGHLRYIKGLDALRAFAVITVIITHWGPRAFHSETLSFLLKLFPNGNFGVDLFFVLSGFLITRILINSRFENEQTNKFQLIKAFFIRRSLRIFPIYFLLVLVLWAIGDKPVGDNIWYFLTYTSNLLIIKKGNWYSNLSHTWSLAVEEQFYLLWPWIIVFVPKKYLLSAILCFLGLGIVSSLMLYVLYGKLFYILMPACLIAFSIGATYAYVEYDRRFEHFLFTTLKILLPICLIGYLLNQFGHGFVLIRLINSIISICLIIFTIQKKQDFSKVFLENRVFMTIGKISYGIYLYHYLVPKSYIGAIDYLNNWLSLSERSLRFLKNPPPAYLIELALVFGLSYISFYYFEKQFIRLKTNFRYNKSY